MDNIQETKLDNFDREAKLIFQFLVDKYGYKLFSVNKNTNSVYHYYLNEIENLKIEISNAPYYTDYGFSIFIYNQNNGDYFLIYNIPGEIQNSINNDFLINVYETISMSKDFINVISDKSKWNRFPALHLRNSKI